MPTFEQIQWLWNTFGAWGIFGAFMWYWVLPRLQIAFDKHIALVDALTVSAIAHAGHHEKTHAGLICLGNAALESTSPETRARVEPFITVLKDRLNKPEKSP